MEKSNGRSKAALKSILWSRILQKAIGKSTQNLLCINPKPTEGGPEPLLASSAVVSRLDAASLQARLGQPEQRKEGLRNEAPGSHNGLQNCCYKPLVSRLTRVGQVVIELISRVLA